MHLTEDKVRELLKNKVKCHVGQLTTFKELKFIQKDIEKLNREIIKKFNLKNALSMKPDGWYFEKNFALVCETKNSKENIDGKNLDQLFSYMYIANTKYENVAGIIFNGNEHEVYRMINGEPQINKMPVLESVESYKNIFNDNEINKNAIYKNTKTINDILHFSFDLKNLNHRMIWTSCVLVANRFGNKLNSYDSMEVVKQKVIDQLNKEIENDRIKNAKLNHLIEIFKSIRLKQEDNITNVQAEKEKLIDAIDAISNNINSNNWNGEDVMAIFFNEFTRYKGKSENGQVFTPDHITSLMYKLANIKFDDHVLDACCGSGSFLTKSMCNMIKEAGGPATEEAKKIKQERIFGIENDEEIHALACANMLLHKDGKSNIVYMDAKGESAGNWIKDKKITKVLMNPPYEKKYKPIFILENVLKNIEKNADCLFLMPNNKLRTNDRHVRKILKSHTLKMIIKLPSETFQGMASTGDVSIFHFVAHQPHGEKDIVSYWIKEDGLETVKNQGRHDISNKWKLEYEPYWIKVIQNGDDEKYKTKKIIKYTDSLEYPDEIKEFKLYQEDFDKVILDRIFFENPELAKKFSPYSAKNNPEGISHSDWIINSLKLMKEKNE